VDILSTPRFPTLLNSHPSKAQTHPSFCPLPHQAHPDRQPILRLRAQRQLLIRPVSPILHTPPIRGILRLKRKPPHRQYHDYLTLQQRQLLPNTIPRSPLKRLPCRTRVRFWIEKTVWVENIWGREGSSVTVERGLENADHMVGSWIGAA